MNRGTALLLVAFALVAAVGVAAAGPVGTVVAQDDPAATNETGERNGTETVNEGDISPGERLSGVIGVQRAEISGEVESRAFEVGLNRTATPEERADLVAERVNRTEERLAEIEERQQTLRERRDAGELTPGGFAARMAETSARAEAIKREANRSAEVAQELPEAVRIDRGLTEERLVELRERAGNASGPEVAAIARGVAGNDVGGPLASDRRGPPAHAGGGSGDGAGPRAGDRPDAGTDEPGEGPAERGNGTNGTNGNGTAANAGGTGASGDAANTVGAPDQAGNATSERGPNADGNRPDDNQTPPRDGSSSSAAGGDERGNESRADRRASTAVDSAANRLVASLVNAVDLIGGVLVGIDG
ncbi:DUF7096 domain-containing protein [Halorubrum sp. HHNYT27]|uniref:DUF7096 domain-containing protein n=1 Tax=Halorubrum sp. HHNYT27 TaxID=3402275 RepID=UPI003EB758D6